MNLPPIPDRMKRFPLWKDRYPIFFNLSRNEDGSPNFKSLSRDRQIECINKNLCALCGQRLQAPYWWIATETEVEIGEVHDNGPMHEECARYACAACPYLANANYRSSTLMDWENNGPAVRERFALATSDHYYAASMHRRQRPVFKIEEWTSLDWTAIAQPEKIPEKSGP